MLHACAGSWVSRSGAAQNHPTGSPGPPSRRAGAARRISSQQQLRRARPLTADRMGFSGQHSRAALHFWPRLGLPLRVLPTTTAILRPGSWPQSGLPSREPCSRRGGLNCPCGCRMSPYASLCRPARSRCLHSIRMFEPSKRTERKFFVNG